MEIMVKNSYLEQPEGTIENIRQIYGFDKPERLAEAINILEAWIKKQDHIIKKDFSKKYLEITLISCKGSVEKAKKQIDRICTLKTLLPSFFSIYNIKEEFQNVLELVTLAPLPKLTNDYYRVVMFKVSNKNISTENLKQFYQLMITGAEYIKAHDYVNSFILVADYSEINLLDVWTKVNTVELQQCLRIAIDGYGARIKNIHVITDSKTVELILKIFRQCVSDKIGNRIKVHPTKEDIQKEFPKEILPVEYGGKERSIIKLWAEWIETLSTKENVEFMKMMSKACTDESKRDATKFNEEYLGMPGSFRNLSVD